MVREILGATRHTSYEQFKKRLKPILSLISILKTLKKELFSKKVEQQLYYNFKLLLLGGASFWFTHPHKPLAVCRIEAYLPEK